MSLKTDKKDKTLGQNPILNGTIRQDYTAVELFERALDMIPKLCPQWTNYNHSDPGITILELMAWLKEIQDFHMVQQGDAHKGKFLKLLGGKRRRGIPGTVWVTVGAGELFIPEGARFYAQDVCFEAIRAQMTAEGIFSGFCCGEGKRILSGSWLKEGKGISLYPFGKLPKGGSIFTLILNAPLKAQVDYVLYLEFGGPAKDRLNPMAEKAFDFHGFYPYVEFFMEYTIKGKPVSALLKEDGTKGFLQNGGIRFRLLEPMDEKSLKLTLVLKRYEALVSPFLTRISLANVLAVQKETVTEPICLKGNGMPGQVFDLGEPFLSSQGFELVVENPLEPGQMETWQQAEDFDSSAPWDRHYLLDHGILKFGDGLNGFMPEGSIRITHYERTLGSLGNLKAGAVCSMENSNVFVTNEEEVAGGFLEETVEEALKRSQEELFAPFCAVTCEDYEALIRKMPGLTVENCYAYVEPGAGHQINIAIQPFAADGKGKLNDASRKNIFRYLEERRMAGTRIRLMSPEYIPFAVVCEAVVSENPKEARGTMEKLIKAWAAGLGFGEKIRTGELFARLEGLEFVRSFNALYLEFGSRIRRNEQGEACLPPNGIAFLIRIDCTVTEEME